MNAFDEVCRCLLVVLANAAWQVAVIGLLTLAVLRLGRVRSPQWRSGLCVAALAAVLACPVLTAASHRLGLRLPGLTWESSVAGAAGTATDVPQPDANETGAVPDLPAPGPVAAPGPAEPVRVDVKRDIAGSRDMPDHAARTAAATARRPVNVQRLLLALYGTGVLLLLVRLVAGELYLVRLRYLASPSLGRLETMLLRLAWQAHVWQRVRIGLSARVSTPVLVGTLRPMILMPADLADLPDPFMEAILLHEIAHIRRHDGLVNLLQRVAEAVLFFHPVVWLLGREQRLQRERCCDAWVVEQTGRELDYARCLTNLAERLTANWKVMPRVAMAEFRHELPRRVVAVLDGSARTARKLPGWVRNLAIAAALAVAGTVSVCGLTIAAEPANKAKPAASQSVASQPAAASPAKPAVPAPEPWQSETASMTVKVVSEDDKPVAGVKIQPASLRSKVGSASHYGWGVSRNPTVPPTPVVTNAEGVATVVYPKYVGEKLEVGYITFTATHPDYPPTYANMYTVDGGEKTVLKKGGTLRVAGYVGSRGNNVPVKVEVTGGLASLEDDAWQDAGNNARVSRQLAAGKHYVRLVHLPADGPAEFSEATLLEIEAGKQYSLDLEIKPGVRVEGHVDASVPRPVKGGYVIADAGPAGPDADKDMMAWQQWAQISPRWEMEVPIAEDGTFVLASVPAGQLQVIAVCDGYLSKSPALSHSPGFVNPQVSSVSGTSAQVEMTMEPTATCEVRVVNDQGQPVEGAAVVFYPNYRINGGARMLMPSGVNAEDVLRGKITQAEMLERMRRIPMPYKATTGADGVAVVSGLPALTKSFYVQHDKYELPAVATGLELRRRMARVELTAGETTTVSVIVQPKGRDSLTDPARPGEKPLISPGAMPPAPRPIRIPSEEAIRNDYVGKIAADGDRTEFHGRVVDEAGQPIEGVLVDAWTWYKGNETRTDAEGNFQLKGLDRDRRVEVRFSKDGYTPRYILQQPTGVIDAVVVLGTKTYFEGTVTDPQGQPSADALVRATPPPQRADGVMLSEVWTQTRTDENGHYRLYIQAGTYEVQARASGTTARLTGVTLDKNEAKTLDIQLQQGLVFRAKIVDSLTGEPVEGVKLMDRMQRKSYGTSDKDGLIECAGLMPGPMECWPEGKGYVRWWSPACTTEWSRFQKQMRPGSKWQRNFDSLSFDLQAGMEPVTITVERGVRIRGKVLDPKGEPVAGATVAPALTGTGNSLTGDTRFSVTTGQEGTFEMLLPAGKECDYNLVAHDGTYNQWRTWANGVLPPIRTQPGQEINDVVLTLTEPATVRGRVVDADGKPVADRQVRASAADKLENRYYDPATRTGKDGTFELKFVRPGKQYIQVHPFWLDAEQAPKGTSQTVTITAGQAVNGIELTAAAIER